MTDPGKERSLHPLLAGRWSPTTFDSSAAVSVVEVELLLEAARWAPSAGNSQPWAFIVGCRGEAVHDRLVAHLATSSSAWAPSAGLLIANLSHRFVEGTSWEHSEFATYDLGQAVAHMTIQASWLGLAVRQFRAFDRAGIAAEFDVPPHWEVTTMSAVGRARSEVVPEDAKSPIGRARRPTSDLRWPTKEARD